jgi:flagellar motor switch protein FliN
MSDSNDEMDEIERQMAAALEASELPEPPPAPVTPPPAIHPVEMDEVKTVPRAPPDPDGNLKLILDIPVEIRVEVGNSRLSISELLNLAPGSIIELDRTAGSAADLFVNGTKVGQGDVVVVDESYGIRLTKLVDPQERISSL